MSSPLAGGLVELPLLGARLLDDGVAFGAFAPACGAAAVQIYDAAGAAVASHQMSPIGDGYLAAYVAGARSGTRYKLVLDGKPVPDPFARWLPDGVHAPASVYRPARPFVHKPPSHEQHCRVLYELHVGTFSPEGNYDGVRRRLPHLVDLGVTTIELMPLSSANGSRGWGYDGVAHFAPLPSYGHPDELRALVDAAHGAGLELILDIVFNHFGPSGNYLGVCCSDLFRQDVQTPWGDALDYRHPAMRRYLLESAHHWLMDMGFDGLRLDATHAIVDDTPQHVLRELAASVASIAEPGRKLLIAEDERNDPGTIDDWGLDGVWADDFHHSVHVAITGERDGYYVGYDGSADEIARTIEQGWLYKGEHDVRTGSARGAPAEHLPPWRFVYCIQNHDQIGNRAFGDRLHRVASVEAVRAAAALLLFLPMTPLLFMGDEWAASSPFAYFTDHDDELGRAVTAGRRREFAAFAAFASDEAQQRIPDPQALATFARSRLDWSEPSLTPHREVLDLYRTLLRMRRTDPVLAWPGQRGDLVAHGEGSVVHVERTAPAGRRILVVNLAEQARAWPPALAQKGGAARTLVDTHRGSAAMTTALSELTSAPLQPWQAVWLQQVG